MLGFERQVGQIARDNCLGLRGVAVSLDRLTVGAPRQPKFMNGPHSGIRRHDANRLSLLVNCHRVERWGILKPVEPFDLHCAQILRIGTDLIGRFLPRRVLHRLDQVDEIAVAVRGAEGLLRSVEAGVDPA